MGSASADQSPGLATHGERTQPGYLLKRKTKLTWRDYQRRASSPEEGMDAKKAWPQHSGHHGPSSGHCRN